MAASTNTSPHCENGVLAVMAMLLRELVDPVREGDAGDNYLELAPR